MHRNTQPKTTHALSSLTLSLALSASHATSLPNTQKKQSEPELEASETSEERVHVDFLAHERQLLTNAKRALFLAARVLSPSTSPSPPLCLSVCLFICL